jgi:hypothetical protein
MKVKKRCLGTTKSGRNCRRYPLQGQDYCKDHFDQSSKELEKIDRWLSLVNKIPSSFRALAQLIPPGAIADAILSERVQKIYEKRQRIFYDELARGKKQLTPGLIQSESFLHAYFATERAALNSHREEKIRMFARLLKAAARSGVLSSIEGVDEYEGYLSILDDLTIKEMKVLIALESYEAKYYNGPKTKRDISTEGLLLEEVARVLEIPKEQITDDELRGIVVRLNRTGCYALMGWRNGPAKDCSLTQIYYRLKSLVQDEEGNLL